MGCERGVSASTLLDFFNQLQVNLPVVLQNVKIVTQGQGPVGGINAVDEGIKEEPASEEEVLSFR